MGAETSAPIVIKRKRVTGGDAHHGGAWKVAYADFVTAMMAFFLLMWLLNATTEKQRKGLADHFSPTIPVNRSSGGGDGALSGDSIFAEETLARSGVGASSPQDEAQVSAALPVDEEDTLRSIQEFILGQGAEALLSEHELRHIVTRITDEGLVVELFSLREAPLFDPETDAPLPLLGRLLTVVGEVFALTTNSVAIDGHSRSHAVVLARNPIWERSIARARGAKAALEEKIAAARIARVVGHADRQLVVDNPMALRNDRLELILLRSDVPDLRASQSP